MCEDLFCGNTLRALLCLSRTTYHQETVELSFDGQGLTLWMRWLVKVDVLALHIGVAASANSYPNHPDSRNKGYEDVNSNFTKNVGDGSLLS